MPVAVAAKMRMYGGSDIVSVRTNERTDETRFMASVLLDEPAPAHGEAIVEALKAWPVPGCETAQLVGKTAGAEPGTAVLIEIGRTVVTVMYIDQALPPGTLNEALAQNRVWKDAAESTARHTAHYIVSHINASRTFPEVRQDAVAITLVCAALCKVTPANSVNWVASQTIVPAAKLDVNIATLTGGTWPLPMWVNLLPYGGQHDADGRALVGVLTQGLTAFVGREIHFVPGVFDPKTVQERAIMLADYLIGNGAVLGDGDTVGISESERIRVRYVDDDRIGVKTFELTVEQTEVA